MKKKMYSINEKQQNIDLLTLKIDKLTRWATAIAMTNRPDIMLEITDEIAELRKNRAAWDNANAE